MSQTTYTNRVTQNLVYPVMQLLSLTSIKVAKIIVAGFIIFQLFCLFLPFYFDKTTLLPLSTFDLALTTHGYEYLAVFALYALSLVLLIPKSKWLYRISSISFFSAFILGFYIGFQFLDTLDNQVAAPDLSGPMTLLYMAYWMFFPLITILFYIPLVSSKENLEKGMKQYTENRKWAAKTPLRIQIIPVIPGAILVVLFVLLSTNLHEYLVCQGIADCHIWGSWLTRTAYFFLGSTLFFVSIFMVFWKGPWTNKNEGGLWKVFLGISTILLAVGTYAGFTSHIITNNEFIDYRDFLNETMNGKSVIGKVNFTEISSLRRDTSEYYSKGHTDCSYTLTLATKNGKEYKFNSDISEDRNFVYFLVFDKKIKPLSAEVNECGAPNDYFKSTNNYIIPE